MSVGLKLGMVLSTTVVFLVMLALNEWIFINSEFVRGVNWVYLPAGVRLLCTLLFGGPGAIGLLIASWLACVYYFFPDDVIRSIAGTLISTAAPYLVYRYARYAYCLQSSLSNLGPKSLLVCAAAYAFANALLHHLWFLMHGDTVKWSESLFI